MRDPTRLRPIEAVYEETRARVVELLEGLGPDLDEVGSIGAPACPGWSVHDAVAHLTGVCADIVSGNVRDAATDAWTSAQVDARRGTPTRDVLAEWDDVGGKVAAMVDDFPGRYGSQVVADLAVHEQDIRGGLGRPGGRDSAAVALAVEFLLTTVIAPGAKVLGLGPLEIRAGTRRWVVGTGQATFGDPRAAVAAALLSDEESSGFQPPPVGHLDADPFELFRAATGRRSAAQIQRMKWTVDPRPHLALFGVWPFKVRDTDLLE